MKFPVTMATLNVKEVNSKGSRFYDNASVVVCNLCGSECIKPRILTCDHMFCKACLKDYVVNPEAAQHDGVFKCPTCSQLVAKPKGIRKSKKSSSECKRDSGSVFYTHGENGNTTNEMLCLPTLVPETRKNQNLSASMTFEKCSNLNPVLRRSAPCHPKSRSAMIFTTTSNDFESKISTDSTSCIYWGGDVAAHGDIVLADWYNHTLKVFSKNGEYVTSLKYFRPPLGVTAVSDNSLLVSFGSTCSVVSFVSYEKGRLRQTNELTLPGHLYSTVRYKNECLGILKPENRRISLVVIGQSVVTSLDIGDVSRELDTDSGLAFSEQRDLVYFTRRRKLHCIKSDGTRIFEKTYATSNAEDETPSDPSPSDSSNSYPLGAMATDGLGDLYISSDCCVLHTSSDGDLIKVIPTRVDPYNVIINNGGMKLVVIGKDNVVELLPLSCELQL